MKRPDPTALRSNPIRRTLTEFARNLAVTFSLPFIDLVRWLGGAKIPRPDAPLLRSLTDNPAGRSLSAVAVRVSKKISGKPLGEAASILGAIKSIALSDRPIIVGPWLSEVGFELLYWIPFLQWLVVEYRIDPARIVVVSRGGVSGWYERLGGRYIDILELYSPEEFLALNQRRIKDSGHQKHMALGEVDHLILERVSTLTGISANEVIHPSMMYQLLLPLWQRKAPAGLAHKYARYAPLPQQTMQDIEILLPERFTAAKFYFSDAFPRTERNILAIRELLRSYLKKGPLVVLSSGIQIDDHQEMLEGMPEEVIVYVPTSPAKNLAMQTAVVARAERFVGTYGGFSYLAPLLGVPSICVFSDLGRLMPMHMDVAFRVFREFSCGGFEKGCPAGAMGVLPNTIFTPIHVDALNDLPM